jgi:hypothetical protein
MQDNILKFSNEEMKVLVDKNFFELKHSSTAKLVELFGQLEVELKKVFSASELEVDNLNASSGKIFRGENYRGFPYVLLDCPRLFNRESVFAFRTMFWWGNEFTFTIHIQGDALKKFRTSIISNFENLENRDILFCINESPWQYHLGEDNYIKLDSKQNITLVNDQLQSKNFVKLSRKLAINEYKNVIEVGKETLEFYLSLLKD